MVSIFKKERRKDFAASFAIFFADLDSTVNTTSGVQSMFAYLNHCLRYWPYRCGATGIDDYLKSIGVDIKSPKEDQDLLYILELIINLLHWAPQQNRNDNNSILFDENDYRALKDECERLTANAEYLLEQCNNMQVREEDYDEEFSKYYITKRNANVDAAVESVPELANVLLGYNDIRNQDDLGFKKNALTAIYNYLEPYRKNLKSLSCGSISEEFFASMNSFGIRHDTKSQVRIKSEKKRLVCDSLFKMSVYILQTRDVIEQASNLKILRNK